MLFGLMNPLSGNKIRMLSNRMLFTTKITGIKKAQSINWAFNLYENKYYPLSSVRFTPFRNMTTPIATSQSDFIWNMGS